MLLGELCLSQGYRTDSEGMIVIDDLFGQFNAAKSSRCGRYSRLLPVEGAANCDHSVLWAVGTKLLGHSD